MPTGNDEIVDETTATTTASLDIETETITSSADINDDIENKDDSTGNNDTNEGKGQMCGSKLPTGTFDPTPYIQRARVTRPAPPKPSCNPMQFVQIKPCNLYQQAQEQLKRAEEVKKVKEIKKEDPEDWQNNLDNWKSSRRKRVEHIIDRVVEVKKLELEEHDRSRRKSKTFSEMLEERTTKGRTNKLASLAVYTEDESNDLSDLGIGTSSTSGKSSLSEDYDNNSVLSDNADTEKTTNFKNNSDNNSNNGDLTENGDTIREYISSPGYDTSSSTAPASSPDPCEYTYEGAIEDYKSRISKAVSSTTVKNTFNNINNNNNNNNSNSSNNMNNNINIYRNNKDSTPERTSEQYLPRRMSGSKIEDRLMNFEIKSANDNNESISSSNIAKKDLPKVDILKRRELFEKENSPSSNDINKERRYSGASGADIQNTKSIRERLSSLEKKPSIEDDKKKINRLSGDITSIKNRLQNLEQNNNQILDNISSDKSKISIVNKISVDVSVPSLKDRLSSLQNAVTKEDIKKPVMLIDEHQLEILKKEDFEKQQALKKNNPVTATVTSLNAPTSNTLLTINAGSTNIDDEQHSNSSHEILSIPDESNIDTDREDSGIHTTDVSCSVSQTDEQAELVNEENHQHTINIDHLHHHHHHNHHHNNNDHNNEHDHHITNNSTSNDLDKKKLSLEIVDSRISGNNKNEDINADRNEHLRPEPSENELEISVSQLNTPKSESPSHSSSLSSSSQTTIFDSKNSFGDGKNINLINNQNHNILLANIDGNNLEGVGTSHNIDLITKNKTINSCNQVVVDLTNSCNASNNKLLTTPSKVSQQQNYNINCIDNDTGRYIICIVNPNNIGNNIKKSYLPKNTPNNILNDNNDNDLQSISKFENSPQYSPIIDETNNLPSFSQTNFTSKTNKPFNNNNLVYESPLITKEILSDNNKSPNLKRSETVEEILCSKIDVHNLPPSVKLCTPCIDINLDDISKCEKNVLNLDAYNNSNLELKNPSPTPSEIFDQIIGSCLTDSSTRSSLISEIELPNENTNEKQTNYARCKSIEEILCDKIDVKNKPPSVHLSTACVTVNKDDIDRIEKNQSNQIENAPSTSENSFKKFGDTPSDILDQIISCNLPDYKPSPKKDKKIETTIFENRNLSSPITIKIPSNNKSESSESTKNVEPPFSPNTMKKLSGIESLMSILNQENDFNKSRPTTPNTPISPQINVLDYKSKKSPLSPTIIDNKNQISPANTPISPQINVLDYKSKKSPLSPTITDNKNQISPAKQTESNIKFSFSPMMEEKVVSPLGSPKSLTMSPILVKKPPVSPNSPIAIRRGLYQNQNQNIKQSVPPPPSKFLNSSKPIAAPRKCPMVLETSTETSEYKLPSSPPNSPPVPKRNQSTLFSISPMEAGNYKNIMLLESNDIPQLRKVFFEQPNSNSNTELLNNRKTTSPISTPPSQLKFNSKNFPKSVEFENEIMNENSLTKAPIPPPRNASSLYKISTSAQNANNLEKSIQNDNTIIKNIQEPLNISISMNEQPEKNSPTISPKPKLPPKPDFLKNSPIPAKRTIQSIRPDNLNLSNTEINSLNHPIYPPSPTQNNSSNSTPKTPGVLVAKLEVVETTIKVTSNDNSPQSRPMSPVFVTSTSQPSTPKSLPSSPILNRSPKFNKKTHPNNTTNINTNSNTNIINSKPKNIFEFIKRNFNNTTNENDESDFNLDEKIIVDNSKFYIASDDIGEISQIKINQTNQNENDISSNNNNNNNNKTNVVGVINPINNLQTNEVNIEIKKIIKTEKIVEQTDNLSPDSNLTAEINQIIDEGIAKLTCDDTKL